MQTFYLENLNPFIDCNCLVQLQNNTKVLHVILCPFILEKNAILLSYIY